MEYQNQERQMPILGNARERTNNFGETVFSIGLNPEGVDFVSRARPGSWVNLKMWKTKAGKWLLKVEERRDPQQQQGHTDNTSHQRPHKYDAPEYQPGPRQPAHQRTVDAPAAYHPQSVARSVASGMAPPQPKLGHTSEKAYDDHGEEIPF
jgi:hypothetical protein